MIEGFDFRSETLINLGVIIFGIFVLFRKVKFIRQKRVEIHHWILFLA
jgi:hypothetical protein